MAPAFEILLQLFLSALSRELTLAGQHFQDGNHDAGHQVLGGVISTVGTAVENLQPLLPGGSHDVTKPGRA